MEIVEEKIQNLTNEPPKFKPNLYPIPNDKNIQAPYFICAAIGCRGSGKTYAIVRMLLNQERSGFKDPITGDKVYIRHILFSPTAKSNPVFSALKYLDEEDIINDYTDQKLYDILEEVKAHNDDVKEYKKYIEAYKKYEAMSDKQIKNSKDYELFALLATHNFIHWKELPEKKQYVVNIILDDCLASKEAFSNKKGSTLVRAVLNSRHIGVNILIASQNLKSITKSIRNNVDVWILFKCKNEKVLIDDIYPEISSLYTIEEFLSYYHYATSASDHDALVYDGKEKNKEDRMKLNLDVILRFKK
jgi:hypothetical protein